MSDKQLRLIGTKRQAIAIAECIDLASHSSFAVKHPDFTCRRVCVIDRSVVSYYDIVTMRPFVDDLHLQCLQIPCSDLHRFARRSV